MNLCALARERGARYLSMDEFSSEFQTAWSELEWRFFKFECRQSYREPGDPSYDAFERGDLELATSLVRQRMRGQAPLYDAARKRGFRWVRVRFVDPPLSDYLTQYEFPAYRESFLLGEEILILESQQLPDMVSRSELTDYLLFDNRCALVHDYDDAGQQHGGWFVNEWPVVEGIGALSAALLKPAIPLEQYDR